MSTHQPLAEWIRNQRDALTRVDVAAEWARYGEPTLVRHRNGTVYVQNGGLDEISLAETSGLLWRFVRLVDGSDRDVCRFVKRHGLLTVTENGVPRGAVSHSAYVNADPVEWYRYYSRLAGVTLRLAWSLNGRRVQEQVTVAAEDADALRDHVSRWAEWQSITDGALPALRLQASDVEPVYQIPEPSVLNKIVAVSRDDGVSLLTRVDTPVKSSPADQRTEHWPEGKVSTVITGVVDWWMGVSFARLSIGFSEEERSWYPRVLVGGTWGAIGSALMSAITSEAFVATCANCGKPLQLKRRPSLGRRYWCDATECRRKMAAAKSRKFYQKHRKKHGDRPRRRRGNE